MWMCVRVCVIVCQWSIALPSYSHLCWCLFRRDCLLLSCTFVYIVVLLITWIRREGESFVCCACGTMWVSKRWQNSYTNAARDDLLCGCSCLLLWVILFGLFCCLPFMFMFVLVVLLYRWNFPFHAFRCPC